MFFPPVFALDLSYHEDFSWAVASPERCSLKPRAVSPVCGVHSWQHTALSEIIFFIFLVIARVPHWVMCRLPESRPTVLHVFHWSPTSGTLYTVCTSSITRWMYLHFWMNVECIANGYANSAFGVVPFCPTFTTHGCRTSVSSQEQSLKVITTSTSWKG